MDLRDLINSPLGVGVSSLLAQVSRLDLAYPLSNWTTTLFSTLSSSALVGAVRSNQEVVREEMGLGPEDLQNVVRGVFNHAGRCFIDLHRAMANPALFASLVPEAGETRELIEFSNSKNKHGRFVAITHQGNFDLSLLALGHRGLNAQVLTFRDPPAGYKAQNKIRSQSRVEATPISEITLRAAIRRLKEGGVVILAADRPTQSNDQSLSFFNRPASLPVGHIRMALAADVPVQVGTTQYHADGSYQVLLSVPLPMKHLPERAKEIKVNAEAVLKVMEHYIRQAPEQWLMYYPVWPDLRPARRGGPKMEPV